MNVRIPKLPAAVLSIWQRLAPRDRQAVSALGLVLLAVLVFVGLWQPAQARLAIAERVYQQRLVLAAEVSRAQAPNVRGHDTQPMAVRLSARAVADGLDLHQLDVQEDVLRLTLSGDARTLLSWIHHTELEGGLVQSLTLDKRDKRLEAQLRIQAAPDL